MNSRHFISKLLILLGIVMMLGTVCMAFGAVHAPVRILKSPKAAQERVYAMMDAVSNGDLEAASANIYGTPDFGTIPEQAGLTARLAWETYCKSLSYASQGEPRATDSGVSIEMNVRSLDVAAVSADLSGRTIRREDADKALQEAFAEALESGSYFQEHQVAIELIYDRGQWWILPSEELTNVLSGSFSE